MEAFSHLRPRITTFCPIQSHLPSDDSIPNISRHCCLYFLAMPEPHVYSRPSDARPPATARDFAAELNQEQAAAATFGDGPLLIIAGAGTGKTRTLVYRVAPLIDLGVAPERLLLLASTR